MSRKLFRVVSAKPEDQVVENINPFEELAYRAPKDSSKTACSTRLPDLILAHMDAYIQNTKFPWKNRQEFMASAVFRLLEDAQLLEKHPLFDDSLAKLREIEIIIKNEELGERMASMSQKIVDMVQSALAEGDRAEARRLLLEVRQRADAMSNRRWRDKLLRVVNAYGELGRDE
jgi:hypothetical protein